MALHGTHIGEYYAYYNDASADNPIIIYPDPRSGITYDEFPTAEECYAALETSDRLLKADFYLCINLISSPRLPNEVYSFGSAFERCSALLVAPKLPKTSDYSFGLEYCPLLTIPATIPKTATEVYALYRSDTSLYCAASIPKNTTKIGTIYKECTALEGEFCIKSTPTSYLHALEDTVNTITIYGDQAVCEAVAATANNGNASWQPWYEPVPAVTDRGQGSYTTADDMTRMVRNGVLAVDTYAPGRMVYHQGDIVREDEWEALVEAAQTIDPTVTMSTHYTNLNKIEKAFDDAL